MLRVLFGFFFACAALAQAQQSCLIETIAGGGLVPPGEGGPARLAELQRPTEVRRGPDGLVYFADTEQHRIRRITAEGLIETVVGTGEIEPAGDGLPGTQAAIGDVLSLEFRPNGRLVWLEQNRSGTHYRIRRLANGVVETVAGGRAVDFSGDGGPAADAGLYGSSDIAVGPDGSIFIAARRVHRIRKIDPDGRIDTIAGSSDPRPFFPPPESAGDGGPAIDAVIPAPEQVLVAPDGALYVREYEGRRIRRITPDGQIDTYLTLLSGSEGNVPDGVLRSERPYIALSSPIEIDDSGRLYFLGPENLRRIRVDDRFETLSASILPYYWDPQSEEGVLTVLGSQVYFFRFAGAYFPLAGIGRASFSRGDGGPASEALVAPRLVAVSPDGAVYFFDEVAFRVRVVREGLVENFAGNGDFGPVSEGAAAVASTLPSIQALATGPDGSLYFGDGQGAVWRVGGDGVLERFAGVPSRPCNRAGPDTECGDGRPARNASLGNIVDLAVSNVGDVYVMHDQGSADQGFERVVRHIGPDGTITALPIRWSPADLPVSMTLDPEGRPVLTRVGSGASPWRYEEDGSLTILQDLNPYLPAPPLIEAGPDGNLFFGSPGSIRRLSTGGGLRAIVPVSLDQSVLAGEQGPAEQAALGFVSDITTDRDGNLYIADLRARRIRRITRPRDCNAFAGPILSETALNAASASPTLAPGVIFTLYGVDLGPSEFLVAGPNEAGDYPLELGGVRVLVDGKPVPLLFVSANQINAVLPQHMFDSTTQRPVSIDTLNPFSLLQVQRNGALSAPMALTLYDSAPGIFPRPDGLAAALNQDGSLNDRGNPAARGSIVVLYGTGGGPTDPPGVDGRLVSGPLQQLTLPVSLTLGGEPAEILYAGSAPGLVTGVIQINARISPNQQALGEVIAILNIDGVSSVFPVRVVIGP